MKKRIFISICGVALVILLLLSSCVVALAYGQATRDGFAALRANLLYLSAGYTAGGQQYLQTVQTSAQRITLIAPDGSVLFDNAQDISTMGNHADRPEVAAALQSGFGQAERQSDTFGQRLLYSAAALPGGNVLRVALFAGDLVQQALRLVPWLLGISLVLVVLAALAARRITARLLAPINELNLDAPLDAEAYDELAPLLRRIAAQQGRIAAQMDELRASRAEFDAVAASLGEGLVLLNNKAQVLSINESARNILDIRQSVDDAPLLLAIARNLDLDNVIKQALAGHSAQAPLTAGGRIYRVSASPTLRQSEVTGAVLLLLDDTEKIEGEERRREFTANVSHELKTPLTSISGFAELIQTGIAKQQDVADFAGRIQREAARLIALIDDIIQLSRLDEKSPLVEWEELNLVDLAQQVGKSLAPAVREKEIRLEISGPGDGRPVVLRGVRPLLVEILYNLVDNAIRYSPPGTRVTVELENQPGGVTAAVADNGPGIAPQHQARVFERFYRVDKSHSKHSGGTGLGLSIVKNGAAYHGGTVTLQSTPGQGSRFTVALPFGAPQA